VEVSHARKVNDPQIASETVRRPLPAVPGRSLQRDLAELQRLMRVLERHAPVDATDCRRDIELLDGDRPAGRAELHLRAVAALLVTLETYQHVTATRRGGRRRDAVTVARHRAMPPVPAANGRPLNGRPVNGRPGEHTPAASGPDDTELAAAAARYIARDLAARQLSEFTSAEGYRLARALAKLGRVEAQVERLLAEANQVRLHPMPLADALSHSTH
jgi:hypothetical protein